MRYTLVGVLYNLFLEIENIQCVSKVWFDLGTLTLMDLKKIAKSALFNSPHLIERVL